MKITYHDGSIHVVRPSQDPGSLNRFQGDWGKLAETIARKNNPLMDVERSPNKRLYAKMEIY